MASIIRTSTYLVLILLAALASSPKITAAVIDDAADLMNQQAQEKDELNDMRQEMGDLRSTMGDAIKGLDRVRAQTAAARNAKEVHLIVKEAPWEVSPGASTDVLTYNGQQPGPVIRCREGEQVKIVVHNELKAPTSMYFHGMILPHAVSGLPRKEAGIINPGQSYAFQFIAPAAGTYWYHPQVTQCDQQAKGLCGVIVVEPASAPKTYEKDVVLVLGATSVPAKTGGRVTYYTVNGKSAPAIPPIEVHNGERIRLRLLNVSDVAFPLHLSGHKMEVVAVNGSSSIEPHVMRDTLTVQPGERYDVEVVANNPGVWSLSSVLPSQTSNGGKFPGGIAVVVRYPEELR